MLAGYVILGVVLIGLIVMAVSGGEKTTKNFEVNLKPETGTVYETKLEALRAKQKGGKRVSMTPQVTQSVEIDSRQVAPLQSKVENRNPVPADKLSLVSQQAQQIVQRNKSPISNDEYNQLKNDIHDVYHAQPTQPVGQVTTKEKQKQMIEDSWGKVSNDKPTEMIAGSTSYNGVVHGTQTVKNAGTATFRTMDDIATGGRIVIPKNTLVSGVVSFNQNRVQVAIGSIRVRQEIVPVVMSVYGSDGIKGIPIVVDGAAMEANKEIGDEVIDQIGDQTRKLGGVVGRAVGGVITSTARSVKRDKEREIRLIDNQMIIFKFN